jgi:phospholipid/cholesterol/gamma-HCH transport system substrate-binding protein
MRRGQRKTMKPFTAGLITLVVFAIGTYFGFTKSNPFASHFEINAAFKTVHDLKINSPVRIAGVNVGKVTRVESLGTGASGAVITMRIDDSGQPIHADARAKVRPRIFLEGNYFVDISPGSPSAPAMKEGDIIPATQTAAPVGFAEVLETLQSDTREDLRVLLQEYGKALNEKGGPGYNRSIRYQLRAFRDSSIVNDAMRGIRKHDLSEYIEGAGAFAEGLDRHPEQLKSLITDFAATADALALEERNLSRAIAQLPPTLRTGNAALRELNGAFPSLRRFVADFRPAVRSSGPALDATYPFLRQMRGLVSKPELGGLTEDLRELVPDLAELNEGGVHLQEEQRALSSCQLNVVLPWQGSTIPDEAHPATGTVSQEGVKWLPGIAGESRSFDANGQYIKVLAKGANYAYPLGDERFYITGLPIEGIQPPKKEMPPLRPDVPCETQEPPDLSSNPQAPPRAIRVNNTSPAALALERRARRAAEKWLRGQVRYERLDKELKVVSKPLSRADLPLLRRVWKKARG